MTDVLVTLPKSFGLKKWLEEGDGPEERWTGRYYDFSVAGKPDINPGERVYVVYNGRLIGYAPLIYSEWDGRRTHLIRAGGARAVTTDEHIRGFQGYRYRWWEREEEYATTLGIAKTPSPQG